MSTIERAVSRSWWQKRKYRDWFIAFLFVFPALVNFTLFRYYPMAWAIKASFWEYNLMRGYLKMVGFGNYARALTSDPAFWQSMKVTLTFVAVYVPIQIGLALALAVFANQRKPGMGAIRAFIFVPVVISFVVVSIIWGMLLNSDVGIVNGLLQTLGLARLRFINSVQNALPTIIMISIWKNVGYSVIILVAGLKGVPGMYYEAATVDGANGWQQFWKITIPMLRRQLMFVTVWATLGAFQVFIPIYTLTDGGPNRATNVIVYYLYKKAFVFGEMGYASALSIILLLILLGISAIQMRLMRSEEVVEGA